MPIRLPEKCLRYTTNYCKPLSQIASDDGKSFICCGLSNPDTRTVDQDKFRLCWKNDLTNQMHDYDERDMKDTLSVLAQALSVDENMRVNQLNSEPPAQEKP